jgi:hypothetical protein
MQPTGVKPVTRILPTLVLAAMSLAGCVTTSSTTPASFGGYAVGMQLRTRESVAVKQVDDGLAGSRLALVPTSPRKPRGANLHDASPGPLAEFCNQGVRCRSNPEKLVALLPPGVVLAIVRIERRQGINPWFGRHDDVVVYANSPVEIQGQARLVDVTDLSVLVPGDPRDGDDRGVVYAPDPAILVREN